MPRVYVCVAIMSLLTCVAHVQEEFSELPTEQISGTIKKNEKSDNSLQEELFRKSFSKRRREQLEAVRSLRKMDSYERLYKMIMILGEKVIEVIESSRTLIENAGYSPHNSSFPEEANVRNALSNILENTAFFGDIILHIPYITQRILKTQQKWNSTIYWCLNFANQTRHLLDKGTLNMINLVGQELNVTKRESGYFNPYWPSQVTQDTSKKKKSSRKEKRKKGPQMIKIEL